MRFQFAAFADESDQRFEGQIAALKRNGYDHLEIRGVNGKNVTELTQKEAAELAAQLRDNGLSVRSIGSPIGKISILDNFAKHIDLYKHTLSLADTFGAKQIRLFSFYIPTGEDPWAYEGKVLDQMAVFAELAGDCGIIPCHENEKGIFGDMADRCLKIHQQLPGVRAVFDPANFVQCGQDTLQAWRLLAPYVEYMHIKDALPDGRVVPPGQGIGNVPALVKAYADQGGSVLSLEPHLFHFVGLNTLERKGEESGIGSLAFATAEEAFDHAAATLNNILEGLK